MKYICFGYLDTTLWATHSQSEQLVMMDRCLAYDKDVLKKNGHWARGEGLQPNYTTLRLEKGKVTVTDGPYVETKEFLGGLLILEARDLNQAIQLISNHPGMKMGPWEIRPVEDITDMIRDSERRQAAAARPL